MLQHESILGNNRQTTVGIHSVEQLDEEAVSIVKYCCSRGGVPINGVPLVAAISYKHH